MLGAVLAFDIVWYASFVMNIGFRPVAKGSVLSLFLVSTRIEGETALSLAWPVFMCYSIPFVVAF